MSAFTHLHCHTEYSLLDGAIRLGDLCSKALEYKMSACAITDHGNLFGAAYFYKACKDHGLKPILGCEVYINHNHLDKSPETGRLRHHLILLAQNMEGYHNLLKLVSESYISGLYYKPRVDKELLKKWNNGLICLSACISGEIPRAILEGDKDKARVLCREYAAIFPGRFYLEMQHNALPEQEKVNNVLMELAKSEKLPLVATNDCHYLNREDAYAHEVLVCIQTQKTMTDPNHMRFGSDELFFKSGAEMEANFKHCPEALENTESIAAACNVELDFDHHYFPVYPLPEGASLESEFRRLAVEGLQKRLEKHPDKDSLNLKKYEDRLEHEISVIEEMGFAGYFLIVQEFINWAKDHGIPVGPGRGSAAGSLTAWALRITNLDPLPYNLLFERFLNSERVSLPDIDVDFCERRRLEVIRHMADTYGKDSVAQITTFGTMKAKGVVRDVGRALGMSYSDTDRIARLVPDALKMTIKDAMKQEPELKRLYETSPEVKHLLDVAMRLEGLTRHASTHAAGLVVSDKPMVEYLPLYTDRNEKIVTQFDGPMTEKTGLVKFDFLGLKTMTLIYDTLGAIADQGKPVPDLDRLPMDDPETYELYSRGDTDGIFQVESSGMRQYLRMLKPSCFEDIIAMLALYRPGPLGSGMVDEFIKRKHGQEPIVYPHESLRDCLRDTYGVIVYQEQVMQIAQIIAKYSLGGADLLRRAMGKKKAEVMKSERVNFVKGATENGIDKKTADDIFDLMEKFAAYGFNKSHSAAYALISYQTAWLKSHYKVEFMAALLTSEMGNQDKLLKYISACKEMGIEVVPPSINQSVWNFSARDGKIIFGLGGIKNVGREAVEEILKIRQKEEFNSMYNFCFRANSRRVSKRVLESFIKGGAFDCFGASRSSMLACMDVVAARAAKDAKSASGPQVSLLALAPIKSAAPLHGVGMELPEAHLPEMDDELKQTHEKEALGFFLTSHPLQPYRGEIDRLNLFTLDSLYDLPAGSLMNCAVLVTSIKEIITKSSNKRMAFVTVEDLTGHAELTFLPKYYESARELLHSEKPLCLTARVEQDDFQGSDSAETQEDEENPQTPAFKLMGTGVKDLLEVCQSNTRPVRIFVPLKKINTSDLSSLKRILGNHPGMVKVEAILELEDRACYMRLGEDLLVTPGPKLNRELKEWIN